MILRSTGGETYREPQHLRVFEFTVADAEAGVVDRRLSLGLTTQFPACAPRYELSKPDALAGTDVRYKAVASIKTPASSAGLSPLFLREWFVSR
jgi:hypothetical protein